jgi:hypothetical protein
MSKQQIQNWCDAHPITVGTATPESIARHGPLVEIWYNSGPLAFHHAITPAQARQMAQVLINLAAESECIAAEVTA